MPCARSMCKNMAYHQKDNSTFQQKSLLRKQLLKEIPNPVILETHGGMGKVYEECYRGIASGVVFETDPQKAEHLAKQRPTWSVYESDCIEALRAGVGAHLAVNFVDMDPYGEPWHVMDALFESERPWPARLALAVNDGLRMRLKIRGAWGMESMAKMVSHYLDICRELTTKKAGQRGYTLARWVGYYCGAAKQMTHFAAVLEHA